jgi:hypothetical protein
MGFGPITIADMINPQWGLIQWIIYQIIIRILFAVTLFQHFLSSFPRLFFHWCFLLYFIDIYKKNSMLLDFKSSWLVNFTLMTILSFDDSVPAGGFSSLVLIYLSLLSLMWLIDSTCQYAFIHCYASSLTHVFYNLY